MDPPYHSPRHGAPGAGGVLLHPAEFPLGWTLFIIGVSWAAVVRLNKTGMDHSEALTEHSHFIGTQLSLSTSTIT